MLVVLLFFCMQLLSFRRETVFKILLLQDTQCYEVQGALSTKDTQTLINLVKYVDIIMKKCSAIN